MKDPSIGQAIPMIHDKAVWEIEFDDDISAIGDQKGVIATRPVLLPQGALETALVVYEKILLLDEASHLEPGLILKVLKIRDEQKVGDVLKTLRLSRNQLAHPHPGRAINGTLDFTAIPRDCQEHAKLLIEWDHSPYSEGL
jgi:hypothetical protein